MQLKSISSQPQRLGFSAMLCAMSFLAIVLAPLTWAGSSAVLGIDLGTENIKAALVKPGVPLDIVLTKDSKRKETAAIAFKAVVAGSKVNTSISAQYPERVYGSDAIALSARFPKDVYANLKALLTKPRDSAAANTYAQLHPELDLVNSKISPAVGFKSNAFTDNEPTFLVEELLSMQLENIKANADAMGGKGFAVEDVVITVPAFYTAEERRAVITAAELADLNVLSLITDGMAVALNFATPRTFPKVGEGEKPEIHLVYDMGAGTTTATILKFYTKSVKDIGKFNKTVQEIQVIGSSWDATLGGDALNALIIDDMVQSFVDKPSVKEKGLTADQLKAHGRSMSKLLKESQRVRQVLSANAETSAFFEGFYFDDQDLKYSLSRADFEKMANPFISRVKTPILQALELARLSIGDIDSIILHGGAIRTPFVQKELETIMGNSEKVRNNVNSDEAAVFGAGFKAATISPSFRVKEIRTIENSIYPVFAAWTMDGKDREQRLFVPSSQVGPEKTVVFRATTDFQFTLLQKSLDLSATQQVSIVKTLNLTESTGALLQKAGCAVSDTSTNFTIRLNPTDGLPEVVKALISCRKVVSVETERKGVVDGVKGLFGFGKKDEQQKPLANPKSDSTTSSATQSKVVSSSSLSPDESKTSSDASVTETSSETGSATTTKAPRMTTEPKDQTIIIPLNISTIITGSNLIEKAELARIQDRLAAFDMSDRARILRDETFNTLEGYAYKVRDIVDDEGFMNASTSAQRDAIVETAAEVSNWLYGDGATAARDELKTKLDELRGLVTPIEKRKKESASRPTAVKNLREAIKQANNMLDLIKQKQEAEALLKNASSTSFSSTTPTASTSSSESSANSVPDNIEKSTAEPAFSSSNSTSTQSANATSSPASGAFDDLDDMDNTNSSESTSSSIRSSKTTSSAEPIETTTLTEAELKSVVDLRDATESWLNESLTKQDQLGPADDPVIITSVIQAKTRELGELVTKMIMKQMKAPHAKRPKVSATTIKPKKPVKTPGTASGSTTASTDAKKSGTDKSAARPKSTVINMKDFKDFENFENFDKFDDLPLNEAGEWSDSEDAETASDEQTLNADESTNSADDGDDSNQQKLPSEEEQMKMQRIQDQIDRELAEEKSSLLAKSKTAARATKSKSASKSKTKSKSNKPSASTKTASLKKSKTASSAPTKSSRPSTTKVQSSAAASKAKGTQSAKKSASSPSSSARSAASKAKPSQSSSKAKSHTVRHEEL